jgi:hypothetical protein
MKTPQFETIQQLLDWIDQEAKNKVKTGTVNSGDTDGKTKGDISYG